MRRRDIFELTAILAVWFAAILLIKPTGNFPLGDDWDFAIATWNFAHLGHFKFTHFTAVSLRAQVVWGALWTWAFGESFRILRYSVLALAAVTIVVINRLLARANVAPAPRVIATLAFAFHPIFLWASCTYMTEVPYVCASAIAMYCFLRGLDDDRRAWIVAGCLAAVVSWFVRQTGVINLVAPLAIALWRRRYKDAAAIGATLAAFAALFFFKRAWISGSPEEFAVHYRMWGESSFRLPQQIEVAYHWFVFNAQNSALFFLPLVAPLAFVKRRWWPGIAAGILILWRVQALISAGHPMPYSSNPFCCDIFAGNIFENFGLGSHTVTGAYPIVMPYAARLIVTYASVLLAALLFVKPPKSNAALLSLGTAIVGTLALLGSGLYVDRYALDSAWSLVIFLALVAPVRKWLAIPLLIIIMIFSVTAVAEYHSWNKSRWQAVADLRARGVAVTDIDGGAEVWSLYEMAYQDQKWRRIRQFGVGPRRYVIAFSPLPGYRVIGRYGVIYVNEASETSD